MTHELQSLRERISRAPTNRRGYRQYGQRLRRDIENHAASRVVAGASYKEIAEELGMAAATLLNWSKKASAKSEGARELIGFRPVEVQDEQHGDTGFNSATSCEFEPVSLPVVVLPSGVRVEGISLTELASFLARLECR